MKWIKLGLENSEHIALKKKKGSLSWEDFIIKEILGLKPKMKNLGRPKGRPKNEGKRIHKKPD